MALPWQYAAVFLGSLIMGAFAAHLISKPPKRSAHDDGIRMLRRVGACLDGHLAVKTGTLIGPLASISFDTTILRAKQLSQLMALRQICPNSSNDEAISDLCATNLEDDTCCSSALDMGAMLSSVGERLYQASRRFDGDPSAEKIARRHDAQ